MCDADGHGCEPATQSFSLCHRTKASVLTKRYVTLALLVVPLVSVIVLVQLVLRTETKTQGDVPVLPVCIRAILIPPLLKKAEMLVSTPHAHLLFSPVEYGCTPVLCS